MFYVVQYKLATEWRKKGIFVQEFKGGQWPLFIKLIRKPPLCFVFLEHEGDGSGHQEDASAPSYHVPEERHRSEGDHPVPQVHGGRRQTCSGNLNYTTQCETGDANVKNHAHFLKKCYLIAPWLQF